jgi:hypothetical protein
MHLSYCCKVAGFRRTKKNDNYDVVLGNIQLLKNVIIKIKPQLENGIMNVMINE